MILFWALFLGILYLNFLEEIKVSKELEILEMDYLNNTSLQETCRDKQPILFLLKNGFAFPDSHHLCTFDLVAFAEKYGKENIFLYENSKPSAVPIKLEDVCSLFQGENGRGEHEEGEGEGEGGQTTCFWSENNSELIHETSLQRYFSTADAFLAPFGTIDTEYDFLLGCAGATIPLRHHRRHSYFLFVMRGDITLQLAPYKYKVNMGSLVSKNDYVYTELGSKQVQEQVPWMEVGVSTGSCLFVPPYWWHEIAFTTDAQVAIFMYDNVMNAVITQVQRWTN